MTTAGFCEVAAVSRYTSGRPSNSRAKIGKSARTPARPPEGVLMKRSFSATGGIRLDVLARRGELAGHLLAHECLKRLVCELCYQRLEEPLDDHPHGRRAVEAAGLHVEDGRL